MKPKKPAKSRTLKLPPGNASYRALSAFFDQHDGADLIEAGITEIDYDHSDLDRMMLEYWSQPNTRQVNVRIPASAKRLIEKLAKRKTVEVSTLVRMWVIDGMRREASQP